MTGNEGEPLGYVRSPVPHPLISREGDGLGLRFGFGGKLFNVEEQFERRWGWEEPVLGVVLRLGLWAQK
jgi:hypothetical protein